MRQGYRSLPLPWRRRAERMNDHHSPPSGSSRRALLLASGTAAAGGGVAILVASCGGSGSKASSTETVSTTQAQSDAAILDALRSAGLRVTATPGHELYVCEPAPDAHPTAGLREAELRSALRLDRSAS